LYEELYRCQFNLAGIYQRFGNLSQAIRHVDLAIKCAVTMKDRQAERESLILKGTVRAELVTFSALLLCCVLSVSAEKCWLILLPGCLCDVDEGSLLQLCTA
jgi:hypothetical protein